MIAYIVVREYTESYAPGNSSVDTYWQHYDKMYYYTDLSSAKEKRKKWVSEQLRSPRCKFCPQTQRVKIYEVHDGKSFEFPDPYASEDDTTDLWTEKELEEGKNFECEGYLGCRHCPPEQTKRQDNINREVIGSSNQFQGIIGCQGPHGTNNVDK